MHSIDFLSASDQAGMKISVKIPRYYVSPLRGVCCKWAAIHYSRCGGV